MRDIAPIDVPRQDSDFELEWRMSIKQKSKTKSLMRGDSFEDIMPEQDSSDEENHFPERPR